MLNSFLSSGILYTKIFAIFASMSSSYQSKCCHVIHDKTRKIVDSFIKTGVVLFSDSIDAIYVSMEDANIMVSFL